MNYFKIALSTLLSIYLVSCEQDPNTLFVPSVSEEDDIEAFDAVDIYKFENESFKEELENLREGGQFIPTCGEEYKEVTFVIDDPIIKEIFLNDETISLNLKYFSIGDHEDHDFEKSQSKDYSLPWYPIKVFSYDSTTDTLRATARYMKAYREEADLLYYKWTIMMQTNCEREGCTSYFYSRSFYSGWEGCAQDTLEYYVDGSVLKRPLNREVMQVPTNVLPQELVIYNEYVTQ